jgi:hypothetical protein
MIARIAKIAKIAEIENRFAADLRSADGAQ